MDLTLSPTDGTAVNRQIYPVILKLPDGPQICFTADARCSAQAVVGNPERVESRLKSRQLGKEDPAPLCAGVP
jgi:hypothetical protein